MGYILADRLEVSVFIDGTEYPLGNTNLLNYLLLSSGTILKVPTLELSITDVTHVFDVLNLQDGIPISVVIKPMGKNTRTYNFRKYNHRRQFNGSAYQYVITGYWDAPLYWNATSAAGYTDTSSGVLATIAAKCGIPFDGVTTNDSQLWMQKNRSYSTFATDIALHGYVSDNSCMCLGVGFDGIMLYKDINNLPAPTRKVVAYKYQEDAVTATDIQLIANSGLSNAITGYQNMRYAQSTTQDTTQTQIQDLAFTPDTRSPLYNKALKDKLTRGPVRFGPIDVGNVNDSYERASYQNTRYRNLFSMGVDMLIPQLTDFSLMEQLTLSVQREDASQDSSNSGVYTISQHAIYIQGATYAEKIRAMRHGTNENYVDG